jgi:hypothetical protein
MTRVANDFVDGSNFAYLAGVYDGDLRANLRSHSNVVGSQQDADALLVDQLG